MKLEKLEIDPRIIFWLLLILMALPLILPLGLPITISNYTVKFKEVMESVPAGGTVILSLDHSVGAATNVRGQEQALARYYASRGNVKIIILGTHQDTYVNYLAYCKPVFDEFKLEYGKNYILFGYIPGLETGIAKLADDMRAFSTDHFGTPINTLSVMNNIKNANDINVVYTMDTSGVSQFYIGQWYQRYKTKIVGVFLGQEISQAEAQYKAGQLAAISGDIRGAAELEKVFGYTPKSAKITDTMSLTHGLILILLVLGNVQYFLSKRSEVKK